MPDYICVRDVDDNIRTIPLLNLKSVNVEHGANSAYVVINHYKSTDSIHIEMTDDGYKRLCQKLENL